MDPILPLSPRTEDSQASLQESRLGAPLQPISEEAPFSSSGTSHPQIEESTNCYGPSLPTSGHPWPPKQSYSPTKTELESHPIRQRLSIQGDEIATGLGTAPEVPLEFDRGTTPTAEELAQEVDRKVPGIMADTAIKEGDAGMFATL